MRHLFVTDLDGTLLGNDSRVSPRSASIITDLSRQGALISVATARTPATVEPLLSYTHTTIPAIVMTGAAMWDRFDRRYLHAKLFSQMDVPEVVGEFLRMGVNPFVYTLGSDGQMKVFHNGKMNKHEEYFYHDRRKLKLKRFILDLPEGYDYPFPPTLLILGIGATPHIEAIAAELRKRPELSVSAYPDIFNPEFSFIEVFDAGVSKAGALLTLKKMVKADRVTVYGDNLNDLPMFAVADEAVAVENACPQVKEAASRVIGPNIADSVALDIAEQLEATSTCRPELSDDRQE